jgi:lipoyl(octanoyl) transferase
MRIEDLDVMPYREAWTLQEKVHAEVAEGGEERILLVEHPPVITLGRRAELALQHLKVDEAHLKKIGVELVHSDRGGDITFHGPGQIVAYPIIRLNDHKLSVGGYVRRLQECMIDALSKLGVIATTEENCVGIWVDRNGVLAKVCAIGVRIRRGVTMHGLALNVEPDLNYYDLIVPCGIDCKPVTSLHQLLHHQAPSMAAVKAVVGQTLLHGLSGTS